MKRYIIGLDLANTSGIAVFDTVTKEVKVNVLKGNPLEQMSKIKSVMYSFLSASQTTFVIEEHVYFKFRIAARSLMERIGFIKWSLIQDGFEVVQFFPYAARKKMLKTHYLNLDKDRKDALLLIHQYIESYEAFDDIQVLEI